MFPSAPSPHDAAEQRGLLSLEEPAITPKRTEALDNAQYMQNIEVDYHFVIRFFHLKCYACFFSLLRVYIC